MKRSFFNFKRLVIKIGSSLFSYEDSLSELCREIAKITKYKDIVLVSSGAIFYGMKLLGLKMRPKKLNLLQATAAVGQNELMNFYRQYFKEEGLNCAQILLTWDDFNQRSRYINAKNTILSLLKMKIIPIINENDTVSTEEIKFGDNDRLSSLVANMIDADLLIILSDVEGFLDEKRKVIRIVENISPSLEKLAKSTSKSSSVGGMISKLEAAKIAVNSGIHCIIADGRKKDILNKVIESPFETGTIFLPKEKKLVARKRWIAFGAKLKGKIFVDEGAKLALLNKKSLLAVGVVAIEGEFKKGEIVGVYDTYNKEFARGKVELEAKDLEKIKGSRFSKEVIHQDNLVIL